MEKWRENVFSLFFSPTKEFMFFLALVLGTACLELTFIFSWKNFQLGFRCRVAQTIAAPNLWCNGWICESEIIIEKICVNSTEICSSRCSWQRHKWWLLAKRRKLPFVLLKIFVSSEWGWMKLLILKWMWSHLPLLALRFFPFLLLGFVCFAIRLWMDEWAEKESTKRKRVEARNINFMAATSRSAFSLFFIDKE